MLNGTEYNNVRIQVLPVGVEAPDYSKDIPKSHRKNAPKCSEVEEVEIVELEDDDEVVEFEETDSLEIAVSIDCRNGYLTLRGKFYDVNETMTWLASLGTKSSKDIMLGDGMFHVFGDDNDGSYRYFRGDFMHKTPARCFGLVEVEPMEDGGCVWRDFSDFEVEATFNLF